MIYFGIGLLVFGALVSVGSFVYAAKNMAGAVGNFFGAFSSDETSETTDAPASSPTVATPNFGGLFGGFAGMFTRHIGAMIGVASGGFISFVGLVLIIIGLVQTFVH